MPATCDVDMNTSLVKRCELQVFDLDRNPVLWRTAAAPNNKANNTVSPIILAVANNYFRGGATVRGEKQTKFYCGKLRFAHHFSQRLIKILRTPWQNVRQNVLSGVVENEKDMNPLRT